MVGHDGPRVKTVIDFTAVLKRICHDLSDGRYRDVRRSHAGAIEQPVHGKKRLARLRGFGREHSARRQATVQSERHK
jgi:hypothetical protein